MVSAWRVVVSWGVIVSWRLVRPDRTKNSLSTSPCPRSTASSRCCMHYLPERRRSKWVWPIGRWRSVYAGMHLRALWRSWLDATLDGCAATRPASVCTDRSQKLTMLVTDLSVACRKQGQHGEPRTTRAVRACRQCTMQMQKLECICRCKSQI